MRYYDPNKPVCIQTDSSSKGLGATLLQEGQPIAYASKALNEHEQNYSQIEKELLAVVYAATKWHEYLHGIGAVVESDHKPLLGVMKKHLHRYRQ